MPALEKNRDEVREKTRRRYSYLLRPPSLHIVTVTNRCNHNCSYCQACRDGKDIDSKTIREVADFILSSPARILEIEFQGGESLLNYAAVKEFIEYTEKSRGDRVVRYRMVSNLYSMDEHTFSELAAYKVKISTSLDGPQDLHDLNREKGSHEKATYWIKYARDHGLRINAMPTITRRSLSYPEEIIGEYVKLGIPVVSLRPVACLGKAKENWGEIGLKASEYFEFWKQSLDYCIGLWEKGVKIMEGSTLSMLERLLSDQCSNMCAKSPCGAGISQLAYSPEGNIFPCDSARAFDEFLLGNVRTDSFQEIMKKTAYLRGINNLTTLCDSCVWNPFCGTCMVQGFSMNENPISIKPRDFTCKLNQLQLQHIVECLGLEEGEILREWFKKALPKKLYSPRFYSQKKK